MPKTVLLLTLILGATSLLVTSSYLSKNRTKVLATQTSREQEIKSLEQQAGYWQNLIVASPSYRDGYLQLAAIYYRLNNDEVSRYWLNRAYEVDPNYVLPVTLSFLTPLLLPRQ